MQIHILVPCDDDTCIEEFDLHQSDIDEIPAWSIWKHRKTGIVLTVFAAEDADDGHVYLATIMQGSIRCFLTLIAFFLDEFDLIVV